MPCVCRRRAAMHALGLPPIDRLLPSVSEAWEAEHCRGPVSGSSNRLRLHARKSESMHYADFAGIRRDPAIETCLASAETRCYAQFQSWSTSTECLPSVSRALVIQVTPGDACSENLNLSAAECVRKAALKSARRCTAIHSCIRCTRRGEEKALTTSAETYCMCVPTPLPYDRVFYRRSRGLASEAPHPT